MPDVQAQPYSWEQLMGILRCPSCRGAFRFEQVEQHIPQSREYGVLSCSCSEYPVLDGIPILVTGRVGVLEHTKGEVEYQGPTPADLIRRIRAGKGLDALLRCIAFPLTFRRFDRVPGSRLWRNDPARKLLAAVRRAQLKSWCLANRDTLSAKEWFEVFFRKFSPVGGDMFSYFFYRLAQPRQLAALALTSMLPPLNKKPLLDLACGFGHLGHNLAESPAAHDVVGVDRNFFQLWVAQYWIAPKNRFICGDADKPLPFSDGAFAATLCCDAFHYFQRPDLVLAEISRCSPTGPVILTRLGNKLVEPNEGFERAPEEYLKICGDPAWRPFGENDLVQHYLHKRPVDLASPRGSVDNEKWLSLVYPGVQPSMHSNVNGCWPHAVGRLAINPIYRASQETDGKWRLQFKFPSDHYAFENVQMVSFHPPSVTLSEQTYRQVKDNVRSPEVERLIEQMVVIGQPQRYTPA